MDIQSTFNSGLQGFSNAQQSANEASAAIASGVVRNESSTTQDNASQPLQQSQPDSVNLSQEIVNLTVAEYQAKASVEVIDSADEALGTLLDVRV